MEDLYVFPFDFTNFYSFLSKPLATVKSLPYAGANPLLCEFQIAEESKDEFFNSPCF